MQKKKNKKLKEGMRVTLDVTADGWSWTFLDAGKVVATSRMTESEEGGYVGTDKASVFEDAVQAHLDGDGDELLDAIDDDDPMDICIALAGLS